MTTASQTGKRRVVGNRRLDRVLRAAAYLLSTLSCVLLDTSGVKAAPFVPQRNAQCATFSPDGRLAATGKSGLSNAQFPPRPHPKPAKCGVVHIWDVATGKIVQRMETFGDLTKLRFSPDGKMLALSRVFVTADGIPWDEVRLWDVASGNTLRQFDRCHGFDFSPTGKSIAILSRTRCVVYTLDGFDKTARIDPLGAAVAVAFSADGRRIVGIVVEQGGDGPDRYAVRLCRTVGGGRVAQSAVFEQPFYTLAFAPDGAVLATGHPGGNVMLWQADNLALLARYQSPNDELQHPFFSPDGNILASAGQTKGDVVFWETDSGKQLYRYTYQRGAFRTYRALNQDERVRPELDPDRFAFSPDGQSFIAGCYGGIIRLLGTGQDIRRFAE